MPSAASVGIECNSWTLSKVMPLQITATNLLKFKLQFYKFMVLAKRFEYRDRHDFPTSIPLRILWQLEENYSSNPRENPVVIWYNTTAIVATPKYAWAFLAMGLTLINELNKACTVSMPNISKADPA